MNYENYGKLLDINESALQVEMSRVKFAITEGIYLVPHIYPNLIKLKTLMNVLPVSTATVERSFSAFGRVMTGSHNKLKSERASDFVTLSMNKDLLDKVDLHNILKKWFSMKSRVALI